MYLSILMLTGQGEPDGELTTLLKSLCAFTAIFSVAMVAIPASMLTFGFEIEAQRLVLKRRERRLRVPHRLLGGRRGRVPRDPLVRDAMASPRAFRVPNFLVRGKVRKVLVRRCACGLPYAGWSVFGENQLVKDPRFSMGWRLGALSHSPTRACHVLSSPRRIRLVPRTRQQRHV
mgnify:CR=1 FL=1